MLEDGVNSSDGEQSNIDPPDNGGSGISGLSSAVESAVEEQIGVADPSESIDPPDNG